MKKIISMMTMAMVLLWSCQEKEGLGVAASGEVAIAGDVAEGQILVGPDGGEYTVNVTSSEGWRVSGLSEWVTLSAEAGKSGQSLTFTVMPNEDTKSRTATYKVFSADAVQAVTITQHPVYVMSLASEEAVNVTSDANKLTVSLISNIEDFDINYGGAESWIKLNSIVDAFGKKLVQFDVNRSSEFKDRSAVITLSNANTTDEVKINVTQDQRDTAFVVGEQRIVKGLEAISLDLVLKSNVDVTYSYPSWLTRTLGETTEKDETGLKSQSVNFAAAESAGSRSASIAFRSSNGKTVGNLYIKQQNPNPIFAEIPDENLRINLESQGWVIVDEGIKCELIGNGINGTSLVIGQTSPNAWSSDPINSIEGLEAFPNLESLTLGSIMVKKIDVSNFPKIKELKLINLMEVEEVNTGSTPITDVTNVSGSYTYTNVPEIVVKGENITNVNFSINGGYYVGYEYTFESFDVTGCPKLATLNVKRTGYWDDDQSSLKYIYMTADQAASVAVTKMDTVEIVVK